MISTTTGEFFVAVIEQWGLSESGCLKFRDEVSVSPKLPLTSNELVEPDVPPQQ
jgi:hypothetical protein